MHEPKGSAIKSKVVQNQPFFPSSHLSIMYWQVGATTTSELSSQISALQNKVSALERQSKKDQMEIAALKNAVKELQGASVVPSDVPLPCHQLYPTRRNESPENLIKLLHYSKFKLIIPALFPESIHDLIQTFGDF